MVDADLSDSKWWDRDKGYIWTNEIANVNDDAGNDLTFKYSGSEEELTTFEVYEIEFKDGEDNDWYYMWYSFCIPPNHWRWAYQTGTAQCAAANHTLPVDTASVTFYINYDNIVWDGKWYSMDGTVSPAKVTDLILVTADPFSDDVSVQLHWDRSVYQCNSSAHSAISGVEYYECTDEIWSNCSQIAFAVEVSQTGGNLIQIESLNITDEDGIAFSMRETICFDGSHIVIDLTSIDGWINPISQLRVYDRSEYQDGFCFNTEGVNHFYCTCC